MGEFVVMWCNDMSQHMDYTNTTQSSLDMANNDKQTLWGEKKTKNVIKLL